jgi:hypothetical protein
MKHLSHTKIPPHLREAVTEGEANGRGYGLADEGVPLERHSAACNAEAQKPWLCSECELLHDCL